MAKSGADVSTSAPSSGYLRHRSSRIIAVLVVIATLLASSSEAAAIAAAAAGDRIQLPVAAAVGGASNISVQDGPVDGLKTEKPTKTWNAEPGNSMTSSQRDEEETIDLADQQKLKLIEKSLQESEELASDFNLPSRFDYKGWSDDDVEFNEPGGEWPTLDTKQLVKRHTGRPDDVTAMTAENMESAAWSGGKTPRIKRDLADNEIDEAGDVDRETQNEMERQEWQDYVTNRRPVYEGERIQDGAQLLADEVATGDVIEQPPQRPASSLELSDSDAGQQEEDAEETEMERQSEEEREELDEEDYRLAERLLARKEAQDAILEYVDDLERQRERLQQQEEEDARRNSASAQADVEEQPTPPQVIPVMYHGVRGVFVPDTSIARKRSYKPSSAAAAAEEEDGHRQLPVSFSVDEVRAAADRWSTLVREEVKKALDEYDLVYRLADALKNGERSKQLSE